MYPNLDALIARIALSLWTSDRKVERVPTMTIVQPWEVANIARPAVIKFHDQIMLDHYSRQKALGFPRYEGI